ncbi:GntR family transcriptional regulator [Paenibacillus psychroresistens]|uniref:GntR family transcriptional regulator n=1 Tax=Paenibacillus psychroresistens TaxID=1778678 RepID=A0A6B8RCY0_9BACL|nr:GntR family transcriptional regulator [Paenibacillus psychroresistens]QGQ94109.1 GntR family transcriptional regulator [Paenibacillus psychroresistens]
MRNNLMEKGLATVDYIKKENLSELVSRKIRRAILLGDFANDLHLAEPNLAKEFGTSRGPIRDALQMLIHQGFAERLSNGRVMVKRFTVKDIQHLYEFRYILESHAVLKCANYADISISIERLYGILDKMSNNRITASEFSSLDMDFHKTIVIMSHNKSLIQSWYGMEEVIKSILEITNQGNPRAETIVEKHRDITKALEKKDFELATMLLKEHFNLGEEAMINNINKLMIITE